MMITYQQEKLRNIITELNKLLPVHWDEVGMFDKHKTPLNPDFDTYLDIEDNGRLFVLTVRDDKKLVGYYISFILNHVHYKDTLVAQGDIIFLDKPYRRGSTGIKLIRLAEKKLKTIGVNIITVSIKTDSNLHNLIERLKYKPLDSTYFKEF